MPSYILPSGITAVAGGTRTLVRFERPWQMDIHAAVTGPDNCPLEVKADKQHLEHTSCPDLGSGWRMRQNEFTPFTPHYLILPITCAGWDIARVRTLGGLDNIQAALTMVNTAISNHPGVPLKIAVHVGYYAGQNVGHLHWHAHGARPGDNDAPESTMKWVEENPLILFDFPLRGVIGGSKAAKCWFHDPGQKQFRDLIAELAATIDHLVTLYSKKFMSAQGLPPDYNLFMRVAGNGKLQYGCFTPILNQNGSVDTTAIDEGGQIALPWPHETSLQYLLQD